MIINVIKNTDYSQVSVYGNVYDIRWGKKDVVEKTKDEFDFEVVTPTEYVSCIMERLFVKPTLYKLDELFDSSTRFPSVQEAYDIAISIGESEKTIIPWLRGHLKRAIKKHDKSRGADGVENFTISGVDVWMDKDTRTGLLLRFQAEKAVGKTDTVLWYEGMQFPLVVDTAIQMLYAIEVYASQTYDKTAEHLAAVDKLASVYALIAYDYKAGYPAQLAF